MKYTFIGMIIAVGVGGLTSCSRESAATLEKQNNPPKTKIEAAPDAAMVETDNSAKYNLVKVEARLLAEQFTANGSVAPDVSRTSPVNSLTGGRAIEIHARLGDEVTKGQLLLRLASQDLSATISNYQKFKADELLAQRQLDRAKLLFSRGALAEKDLQSAEDIDAKAKIDIDTALQQIRLLGGDTQTMSPVIDIKSPSSGVIVEQNVTSGAGVKSLDNSPNLFTIADLSKVWILCDVYEDRLARIHLGDFAEIRLNAYPDRILRGRVSNVARVLDPATRTVKVRLELDNSKGMLRPGMFAVVTFSSQVSQKRAVAPTSAFLRLHDRDWVFVPVDEKHFRRVEVQIGAQVGGEGMQEVLSGVHPGDSVVAQALQLSAASSN